MSAAVIAQQYELVNIDELRTHPHNPRRGDVDKIASSIDDNGFYGSVIAQRSTGYVLAGNHRLLAARERGIDELPVIWLDVDDDRARRILLVDNRSNDVADYDEAQLVELLQDFDELDGTGYSDEDLLALMSSLDVAAATDVEQDAELDAFSMFTREQIVEAAMNFYRERGFPYRELALHEQMQQLNKLATLDSEALLTTDIGYHVADSYHPHRWHVPIAGKRSRTAVDAFNDDERMRRAIELVIDDGSKLNDTSLLSSLGMVLGTQVAANFRPGFALLMYRRFAPDGATVLDTSTGFGGRLIGYAASKCSRYIGIDPNVPTHDGNLRMTKTLGIDGVELINLPAEDVDAIPLRDSCDFAFTSPPYFSKEQYSDDDTQSWQRYKSGDAWREGFLRPMLALQYVALRAGAHNVINIADVKIGSTTYPLVQWTCDVAQELGFELLRVERFPLSRVPGQGEQMQRFEPVIVLHKPEER
jgi:hypothetical protein